MGDDSPINAREADRVWLEIDSIRRDVSESRHKMRNEMQAALMQTEAMLRSELKDVRRQLEDKDREHAAEMVEKDRENETLKDQITAINTALAITGALSGYKKWLFGLVFAIVLAVLGGLASRGFRTWW